jgi:archaellum component FlaC
MNKEILKEINKLKNNIKEIKNLIEKIDDDFLELLIKIENMVN